MNPHHIVIVGAGHAGIEAAFAAHRLGVRVTLVTTNLSRIGYMSCNPSIGGLGKGHIVREVDVLGGLMGLAADATCIQFKRLNARKGPAVRGSRAQCDKELYSSYMRSVFENLNNFKAIESEVKSLVIERERCVGVLLEGGTRLDCDAVVITAGTFMNGVMFVGQDRESGGRVGDKATIGLSDQLKSYGFSVRRLKTGTPARLIKESIDWSKTTPQFGDAQFMPFSFRGPRELQLPQVACYLSSTTENTHEIIRKNLHLSPMYQGHIEGTGPRYCPSIEDKVVRFEEKLGHQTFLEPESLSTNLIYLQGISTCLPVDVQDEFLKTIPGLEDVKVARYGYAVEYDFIEPTQIKHTLETRAIEGLYLAGQVNGTSGYEEAAGQGLVAGANAALKLLGRDHLVLKRNESYLGVLVDDLVTKGTKEPYRMFTSRAEHRLILREDNTLDRLFQLARETCLLSDEAVEKGQMIIARRLELEQALQSTQLVPNSETQVKLSDLGTAGLVKPVSLADLLRRPEVSIRHMAAFDIDVPADLEISEPVEVAIKYHGYIVRQNEFIRQTQRLEEVFIPADIDYRRVKGLRSEEVEKLSHLRPMNLGQAQRISGVNPTSIQALFVFLKSHDGRKKVAQRDRHFDTSRPAEPFS